MAREIWELSLRRIGERSGPALHLTEAEMQNIAENVIGSCLDTEAELEWLLDTAGVERPKEELLVDMYVMSNDADETRARLGQVLLDAGFEVRDLAIHDG